MSASAEPGLDRDGWVILLTRIGEELARAGSQASLVALGSVPNLLAGQPARATLDLDVWNPASSYSAPALRDAVEAAGLLYNPTGVEEPTLPYVQIVRPGIVQLGRFEPIATDRFGGLHLSQPPPENLIASKLCRANARDLADIAWLLGQHGTGAEQVREVIQTFPRPQRQTAAENLVYLEAMLPSEQS